MADLNSTIIRGNLRVTEDINVNGNISENGTLLSSKYAAASHNHDSLYLGKTAKAADSSKLNSQEASYYAKDSEVVKTSGNQDNIGGDKTFTGTLKAKNLFVAPPDADTGPRIKVYNQVDTYYVNMPSSSGTIALTSQIPTYTAGTGLSLSNGAFSVKTGYTTSGKNYKVAADSNGNLYVNVPWTDTDTNTHNSHAVISGTKSDGSTQIKGSASSGDITLGDSGVTAGTYKRVTVNSKGIVVAGDQSDNNTDTWRKVQLDGVDKLGTGTRTKPLNIKAGNNMTITESGGTFTFAASGGSSGMIGDQIFQGAGDLSGQYHQYGSWDTKINIVSQGYKLLVFYINISDYEFPFCAYVPSSSFNYTIRCACANHSGSLTVIEIAYSDSSFTASEFSGGPLYNVNIYAYK